MKRGTFGFGLEVACIRACKRLFFFAWLRHEASQASYDPPRGSSSPSSPLNILTHNSALLLRAINRQRFNPQPGREGENERAVRGDKEGRGVHEHRGLEAPLWLYWCIRSVTDDIVPAEVTRIWQQQHNVLAMLQRPVSNQQPREVTSTSPPDKLVTGQRFCVTRTLIVDGRESWGGGGSWSEHQETSSPL